MVMISSLAATLDETVTAPLFTLPTETAYFDACELLLPPIVLL